MMQEKKRFQVITLGCRTNQYESQAYRDQLENLGYKAAHGEETADLVIINTCTVTESADKHSRHGIRSAVRQHPNAKVIVTGCLAERSPEELQNIPGVTLIVSNKEKEKLIQKIFPNEETLPEFSIKHFEAHTRAFVKVQDGCNSFCTYCIIPYVRGRSRSRKIEEIIQEVRSLVASGYKEVVITGINVGDFDGGDGKSTLSDLIRAVDGVEGLQRLRLSSIDPDEVDDQLMEAIIHGKKTCLSMHIVLQSGSNIILKRMNRKYTRQIFLQTCEKLKKEAPDFTFTTDIIVGFPGETEGDFQQTLEVIERVQFAKVHMFPYSPRERTRAFLYKDTVPSDVIQQRKQEVLRHAEKHAFKLRNQFIGRTMPILTESVQANEMMISSHTDNFLPVLIPSKEIHSNEIVNVKLVQNTPQGLIGELLNEQADRN